MHMATPSPPVVGSTAEVEAGEESCARSALILSASGYPSVDLPEPGILRGACQYARQARKEGGAAYPAIPTRTRRDEVMLSARISSGTAGKI
jgi:uncharacterized protein YbjT (DUF2867 family)